jgi:hypothetical protein
MELLRIVLTMKKAFESEELHRDPQLTLIVQARLTREHGTQRLAFCATRGLHRIAAEAGTWTIRGGSV